MYDGSKWSYNVVKTVCIRLYVHNDVENDTNTTFSDALLKKIVIYPETDKRTDSTLMAKSQIMQTQNNENSLLFTLDTASLNERTRPTITG